MRRSIPLVVAATSVALLSASGAMAADIQAGPDDYKTAVAALQPGDTLHLAAGTYPKLLVVNNLKGTEAQPIVIEGPSSGEPAVFTADPGPCCNTVEIKNSEHVVLRHLTIDGKGVAGAFGVSAKDGTGNRVHHITIEDCTFVGHDADQGTVAISTKTPTWGWVVRRNRISGAGTGLYLGNSNGDSPFVAGVIENNLVENTVGYNVQIKYQKPRPAVDGMPTGPSSTIIRHNVFLKNDRPSPDGDRPNLLVGGFPDSGAGSEDLYEIYGNVLHGNHRESLLQASGRVSIHDNVFVDVTNTAVLLQNHDLPLKLARVYDNTIYSAKRGIHVGSAAAQGSSVFGNLIFAETGVSGSGTDVRDNLTDTVANAPQLVSSPSIQLGAMDFYPLAGKCEGAAIDMSVAAADTDYASDFNGTSKGGFTFRGAYAGAGTNPGWSISATIKDTEGTVPGQDAGSAGNAGAAGAAGGPSADAGKAGSSTGGASGGSDAGGIAGAGQAGTLDGGANPAGAAAGDDDGGCSCRTSPGERSGGWLALIALGLAMLAGRRYRSASETKPRDPS